MVILDGLGGLPRDPGGKTELESANTPNLDNLAAISSLGQTIPLAHGVTVGSGPGHLAMFGYDPLEYEIGRGALEALGVDFDLGAEDLAARGNFCTLDADGIILDRRAGRLPTDEARPLIDLLAGIQLPNAEVFLQPIKEHRFAFVLRKAGLSANLDGTDPLKVGVAPLQVRPLDEAAKATADLLNAYITKARSVLKDQQLANGIMLRGFAKLPTVPSFKERYGLHAAAVAINGMYRGVSRLVGMQVLDVHGSTLADEFDTLERAWQEYNFFYMHFKRTDTCGESGDFEGKMRAIEEFDNLLPHLLALQPAVLIVGGDHSSPSMMQSHSWHPVPLLLHAKTCRPQGNAGFGESACAHGQLGTIYAKEVMPLALAHAGRLEKFGA